MLGGRKLVLSVMLMCCVVLCCVGSFHAFRWDVLPADGEEGLCGSDAWLGGGGGSVEGRRNDR